MWISAVAMAVATPAYEPGEMSTVTASNGVEVSVYSNESENRYEFSAPLIKSGDAHLLITTTKGEGIAPYPRIEGTFSYFGNWRNYDNALVKGSGHVEFVQVGRSEGQCHWYRYSQPSCTRKERFIIVLQSDDVIKHAQDGKVALQISAQDNSTTETEIPIAYIDAVKEVASR